MRLEDALKKSDIPAAKRVGFDYEAIIRYLPNNEGIVLRRVFPTKRNDKYEPIAYGLDQQTYPHLGAIFNYALKNRYVEVRRYAMDWEPLCYYYSEAAKAARDARWAAEAAKKAASTDPHEEGKEEEYQYEECRYLDLWVTGDLDLDRDLERGLDGRIEYNKDDPNVIWLEEMKLRSKSLDDY